MSEPATVVLVHGAWHGAWCWSKVIERLDAARVPSVALDLPMTSLDDDLAATQAALDAIEGPVVLCGHSYGGVVVTGAGLHPAVRHLVYLCAFSVAEGRSAADSVDEQIPVTELASALIFQDDGTVTLDREGARKSFYLDCDPAEAALALDSLRPIAFSCMTAAPPVAAWRERPSTYVVCTDDEAVPPDLQRLLAAGCTEVVDWPTSHSPFLSRPELVADLLVARARA